MEKRDTFGTGPCGRVDLKGTQILSSFYQYVSESLNVTLSSLMEYPFLSLSEVREICEILQARNSCFSFPLKSVFLFP